MKKSFIIFAFFAFCLVFISCGSNGSNVSPVATMETLESPCLDSRGLPCYATWFDFETLTFLHVIYTNEKETFFETLENNYIDYTVIIENETLCYLKLQGNYFNPYWLTFCQNDYEILIDNYHIVDCSFSGENVTFEYQDNTNKVYEFNKFINGNDFEIVNGNFLTDLKIDVFIYGLTVNIWTTFEGC